MNFESYYGEPFRADINALATNLTCRHSESDEVVIQPRTLSTENPVIRDWNPDQMRLFATALFFTVLVDQVCYTYYQGYYRRFRELTMYPKFRGDCPGGCWWNVHPDRIFPAIGSSPGSPSNWSEKMENSEDAIQVMYSEVTDFFRTHMPEVDGEQFWKKCIAEIPGKLKQRSG